MDDFYFAVAEFMQESGFLATYIKRSSGAYDVATSEYTVTETEIPVEAILMDLTLQSNGLSTKFGTLVVAGDKELYVRPPESSDPSASPLDIDPSVDTVRIGTVEYRIVTMKEINPTADSPILYDLYIRR